ncbi:exodeoxyribonuclease V subunit alpha [Edwardsiella piscicida]|uniref:exodeoxyribonuclease V subunit alpha n=1 Tax=Edwardsiella piscicida TaxID=1263550 RepID=UPI0009BA7F47|nr:exodeoxyribonuclease V subunit alpha [Edwardsiella piscicida]ARD17657.1 exodeoxyribonuclease V subunit alpha [Edwardsiella piscicida]
MRESLLSQMAQQRTLRPLDLQFATLLGGPQQPHLALAAALVSQELAAGHVCLPLTALDTATLSQRFPQQADAWPALLAGWDVARWRDYLLAQPCVSGGDRATPLVVSHDCLYLQRLWRDEGTVAAFFAAACAQPRRVDGALAPVLHRLFPATAQRPDWQQVAAAVAVTRRASVISGGPGTGKTTTVARLLAALVALAPGRMPRIQLAAPTGKAAARLGESLGQALAALALAPDQLQAMPREALTLHRLLGARADSARLRYHRDNPLHLDVLVVDEASMVDLPMMARLIEALPPQAQLILLGDRDQLASVEAGAVLGELCRFAEYGFSAARAAELSQLCDAPIPAGETQPAVALRDAISLLRHSYRFDARSGIGQLALAVNRGDRRMAMACLADRFADLHWHEIAQDEDYQTLLTCCLAGYRPMLEGILRGEAPAQILAKFARFRPLCALREGPFGLHGLNERIALTLQRAGLIRRAHEGQKHWYAGRPVMITRNDASQALFNGDIGITLGDEQSGWQVWFMGSDGAPRAVQPNRLPPHETAWAMTVHKSQGSEFDHTLLALPTQPSPVVTRELVYTAITRARQQLTLFATQPVLERAIRTPTERRSGLMARLLAAAD